MAQQLIIPHELPALNQTIEASKTHWSRVLLVSCAPLLAVGFTYRLCGIVEISAEIPIMSAQRKSSLLMGWSPLESCEMTAGNRW